MSDDFAHGPPEAFIDNHEFCLLHSPPQASVHLTLPEPIRGCAVKMGWAEPHPGVRSGIVTATLVMVYAPRNAQELRVVFELVGASSRFAKGLLLGGAGEEYMRGAASWDS